MGAKIRPIICFAAQHHSCGCGCCLPLLKEVTSRAQCHLPEDVVPFPSGAPGFIGWKVPWLDSGLGVPANSSGSSVLSEPWGEQLCSGDSNVTCPCKKCPWAAASHQGPAEKPSRILCLSQHNKTQGKFFLRLIHRSF